MSEIPTPRTNALVAMRGNSKWPPGVATLCRQLERELAEANEQASHWKAQCQRGFNVAAILEQRDALLEALEEISKTPIPHAVGCSHSKETCTCHKSKMNAAISLAKGGAQ